MEGIKIVMQTNPVHTTPFYLSEIQLNITHPPTSWVFLVVSFPLALPPVTYTHSSSPPIQATCPAQLILLDLIILILLGKDYKS
jgi:hypothetical protein